MRRGRRWAPSPRLLALAATTSAVAAWLIWTIRGEATLAGALAGVAALATGFATGWSLASLRASRTRSGALRPRPPRPRAGADGREGREAEEAAGRPALDADPVEALLDFATAALDADRATVWEVTGDRIRPLYTTPPAPSPRSAEGDPLMWAVRERQPIRIDPGRGWPASRATAVPLAAVDGRSALALSVEARTAVAPPDPAALEALAAPLEALLRIEAHEAEARGVSGRFQRLLTFLEELPSSADPHDFPRALARVAAEISDAAGAVVASWEGETGQVLARVGDGGGPAENTYFGVMSGELAVAARVGATVRRKREGPRPRPLAEAGEHWSDPPRHFAVVPLRAAADETRGLVAVWGHQPPTEDGLGLLEALGPLLALQLRHSGDLVHFKRRAHEDALTGLRNRAALEEELEAERQRFHRYRRPVSLLILDLDHFKRVNDTLGHPAGDAALERVGALVRAAIRETDLAARYGGEEIAILMPETMKMQATDVAERLRATIEATSIDWNGQRIALTASIGVSACPDCVDDPAELLRSADKALYSAKSGGRNRVTAAPPRGSGG